jgi:hypothetical protein
MEIGNIVQGHLNEILGLNKDISVGRLRICHQCPLYSSKLGGMCNNRLWLNVETGDISTTAKKGYRRGCGCRLNAKTSLINAACPLGKW